MYDYFSSSVCSILPALTATANEITPTDMISDYEYRCIEQGGKLGEYKACLCNNDTKKEIGAYDETCNKNGVPNPRQEIPFTKMARLLSEKDTTLNPPYKENLSVIKQTCEGYSGFFPSNIDEGKKETKTPNTMKK